MIIRCERGVIGDVFCCHHPYPKLFKGSLTSDLFVCAYGQKREQKTGFGGMEMVRKIVKMENKMFQYSMPSLVIDHIIVLLPQTV